MSDKYKHMTRRELVEALEQLESQRGTGGQTSASASSPEDLVQQHEHDRHLIAESRDRYADLYDRAPFAYVTLDCDGVIQEINQTGCCLLGKEPWQFVGQRMIGFVAPNDTDKFLEHIRKCCSGERPVVSEIWLRTGCGRIVPFQLTSTPSRQGISGNGPERRFRYRTALVDLSDRKKAEEEIRASAERLKLAQSAGGVGTWEYDFSTRELRWSEEKSRMFGLASHPSPVSYETWVQLIHPDDRLRIANELCQDNIDGIDIEYRIVRPDGQTRWMASRGKVLRDAYEARMVGITLDITDTKATQQRLQELNEALAQRTLEAEERSQQLRALASQLTQAENRERRRLALLLHDHLQQLLIALRMKLALLRHQPRGERLEMLVAQSVNLLDQAITASRSLSVELSPPMLYDSGLPAALEWLADRMQEKHGLEVSVEASDEPEDEDIRVFLFQCVRELLFNVVKHADSPRAEVSMHRLDEDHVSVTVRDFGKGFDPRALPRTSESFGLLSIRERMNYLGGRFEITSTPNVGTQAMLIVPVRKPGCEQADKMEKWLNGLPRNGGTAGPETERWGARIRVLVVDDHAVVRQGLTHLLAGEPDLEVVGQAPDGPTAVDYIKAASVDVVLMDFSMPGMNGAEATRRILEIQPGLPVIGMSVYEDQNIAESMLRAGAATFIRKDDPSERLIATIRSLSSRVSGPKPAAKGAS